VPFAPFPTVSINRVHPPGLIPAGRASDAQDAGAMTDAGGRDSAGSVAAIGPHGRAWAPNNSCGVRWLGSRSPSPFLLVPPQAHAEAAAVLVDGLIRSTIARIVPAASTNLCRPCYFRLRLVRKRTPKPPPFSSMNSIPAASIARCNFPRASSDTRGPNPASRRLTVGRDRPALAASSD
jgi:hypothetical protein